MFKKQFELYKNDLLDTVETIRALDKLDERPTEGILEIFDDLYAKYAQFYKLAQFTELLRWPTEHILTKFVKEQFPENPDGILKVLLSVAHDPFVLVVMRDLMSIKNKFADELKTQKYSAELMNACEIHANKFYFKKNNFFESVNITKESVLEELLTLPEKISQKDDMQEEKQRLLEKLPPYFKSIAKLVNYSSELGHVRKQVINRANAAFDRLLAEFAKRAGVTIQDVRLLLAEELAYFIQNPAAYKPRFKLRRQKFLVVQTDFPVIDELVEISDDYENWTLQPMRFPYIAEGEQAVDKAMDALNPRLNLFHYDLSQNGREVLRGNVIFAPAQSKLRGKVRVVTDPRKEILEPGEILVASSTTPDYVAAFHNCIAIITDWGGATSHAAVISRELKKPCIVGTNFATYFLRTGEIIEIDFRTGEIKRCE